MNKYTVVSVVVVLFIFASVVSVFADGIIWEDLSRGNLDLKTVLVSPQNPAVIFIGRGSGIFKSTDGGLNWRNVLAVRGQNRSVNFLTFDLLDKNFLYAAAGSGLFFSANQGESWQRIFQGKNSAETECSILTACGQEIYLGTQDGLSLSKDKGRSWHKASGVLAKTKICAIAQHPKDKNNVYVACLDGVFRTKNSGESWERIFVASPSEDTNEAEEETQDIDETERPSQVRYVTIDSNNPNCLYLASSKGIYQTNDQGTNWLAMTDYGLLQKEVSFLLVSDKSILYAATKSGVFIYRQDRWHELSLRLAAEEVRFLALDSQDNLYVACDQGLFRTKAASENQEVTSLPSDKDEPSISEVQQAAIRYAEVQPEKIQQWRKLAAKKAWLPQVSMGVNRDTTDLWHWEGGSTTKSDDDTLRRGRDSIEWDMRLTWDLGEVIWNDDQTSIDVRSRLMVELRDDILDEVTKLYFERLRVKMEIDNLSIEDRKRRQEKELRLEELTAYLDGFTAGYFSAQLNTKSGS
jgi:hypothetical protein